MSKELILNSSIADEIRGFIDEKHSMGFKYAGQTDIMRRFDVYWLTNDFPRTGLTPENLENWCMNSETEGAGSLATRLSVIRQFGKYLNGIGLSSYIIPIKVKYIPPLPHIFTKPEIESLFTQIDAYKSTSRSSTARRIANEYPILFRLIYLNGLRLMEACHLAVSEINFQKGIITILDGKGNKDRLVYLSEDMRLLCIDYFRYLCDVIGEEPKWFFPGKKLNAQDPIGGSAVDSMFNVFWAQTSFSDVCSIKPTVHSLRHTFVVERINRWMAQGLNFDQMLPYLSKFLGHKTFAETYYYYHYAEDAARTIHQMDTTVDKVIPEVMRR